MAQEWKASLADELLASLRNNPLPVSVSAHARLRARKRVGIPARAVLRAARLAFAKGTPVWVTSEPGMVGFQHGKFVWMFSVVAGAKGTLRQPTLVTVLPQDFFGNEAGSLREISALPRL